MQMNRRDFRPLRLAAVALGLLVAAPAAAQEFRSGNSNERDPVTGYICATIACDTVRMTEAPCLCQKENPSETRLSELRLTCLQRAQGEWVACPIKPRYGTMIN